MNTCNTCKHWSKKVSPKYDLCLHEKSVTGVDPIDGGAFLTPCREMRTYACVGGQLWEKASKWELFWRWLTS